MYYYPSALSRQDIIITMGEKMSKTLELKIHTAKRKGIRKVKANQIYQGDNLGIMQSLEPGKIDLIYIDPPFCAQNVFKSKAWGKEVSFNDSWGGGVNSYIRWLVPRLKECHRLLKDTGIFCLHLDQRSSHYARVALDKIFGENNMVNELIWCYRGGGVPKKAFAKKHDTILVYSKTKNWTFNVDEVRNPYSDDTKERCRHTARSFRKNKTYDKWKPNPKGKHPEDWLEIQPIMPSSKERLGYPTQKPLALLEKLISAFSNKDSIIADFFCGCGTTVSAAQNLGRKWLGADISRDAISVIRERMARDHKLNIDVINTEQPTRSEIYHLDPFAFERKMVEMLGGTPNKKQVGDGGVDGTMWDSTPIQVKKSPDVGRPVIDSFYKHVKNGNGQGIIVALSFTRTAYQEVDRLFNEEGLKIDLVPSDDLIRCDDKMEKSAVA